MKNLLLIVAALGVLGAIVAGCQSGGETPPATGDTAGATAGDATTGE